MSMNKKPHYEKLVSAYKNDKLPSDDKGRINKAIERYKIWIDNLDEAKKVGNPIDVLNKMVSLLNEYKLFVELELIFDNPNDFLYRQKGQLKLDNSIIEEFLPHLIIPEIIPEIKDIEIDVGQSNTFSSIYFESTLGNLEKGGGLRIRSKDQDFAITKRLYLKSSFDPTFSDEIIEATNIAYVVAECKTNLDKTMFQEATATAHDVKTSVPGAKYFLLCEWLDMTPISTAPTDIDEVIILRKAKRMSSTQRAPFSTYNGRQANRETYKKYLEDNPIRVETVSRFIEHVKKLITRESLVEKEVIENGYF